MDKTSAQAEAITMSGSGVYSLATKGAKDVIDNATSFVLNAIEAIPFDPQKSTFVISDMGCADAGTSLSLMAQVIETLHRKNDQMPISIVYTDQPRNDFNALIKNILGLGPFKTYMEHVTAVYPMVSGISFYRQILPEASLNLGFSATAMHWLSKKPTDLSNHVHMVGATEQELETFRTQGHQDWRQILLHRSKELIPGGKLVLVNFGIDANGQYLGNTGGVNMFNTFHEIWMEFLEAEKITKDEYWGMTFPQYYNTVEEFSAPFLDANDPVYQSGLRLEHIETQVIPCPFALDFQNHQDSQKFADDYIPTLRTWSESIYFNALSVQRSLEERQALIENFYDSYQTRVRENPSGHGMDYVHAYMVITKQ